MPDYALIEVPPSVEDYRALRKRAGLSERTREAAEAGLPNTWVGVRIEHDGEAVGMGRIVGDGGCFFKVVDIAVLPEHQGQGLGKRIMSALMRHFEAHAPESASLSLIADGEAKHLYAQFGFQPTAPQSIGMTCRKGHR
ncbi:MAG: GNAT family N-acetyltransferase [Candidatus Bipolaricaulia bacterium]